MTKYSTAGLERITEQQAQDAQSLTDNELVERLITAARHYESSGWQDDYDAADWWECRVRACKKVLLQRLPSGGEQ